MKWEKLDDITFISDGGVAVAKHFNDGEWFIQTWKGASVEPFASAEEAMAFVDGGGLEIR